MPYAQGRIFNDADSHVMETRDWMTRYADPGIRERLAPLPHRVGRRSRSSRRSAQAENARTIARRSQRPRPT